MRSGAPALNQRACLECPRRLPEAIVTAPLDTLCDPLRLARADFTRSPSKALLGMQREGAELLVSECLNKCMVEEIMQSTEKKEVRL